MRYVHHLASWLIGASAVMAPVLAHAESSPVEASISYLGGVFGTWSLTNTSDSAFIQSVTINLAQKGSTSPGNLYFDTSFSAPGELLPFPFTPLTGASSTGFQTAVGAADGSTQLILNFSDFAPGELFSFELDVDHTRPTGFLNGLNRSTVTASEISGSTFEVAFAGTKITPASFTGTFAPENLLQAQAQVFGEVSVVPEPSSIALLLSGIATLGVFARKRSGAKS